MNNFGNTASKLSKNPLGILALLIVLVYAIAGLVSVSDTFSGKDLSILVWFMVSFPVIVLVALVFLVAKCHDKLYAPSDFANENNFVSLIDQSLSKSEKFIELNQSTKNIETELEAISEKDSDIEDFQPVCNDVESLTSLSEGQRSVLIALRDGKHTYRSISGVVKDTALSRAQVERSLHYLEDNLLCSSRDRGNGLKYFISTAGRQCLRS